ncbi:MAG: hypothetical protein BGO89_05135 [Candidatus Kapaibacterium thiocyanatum]|uniref:Uncharacterized protein n=1 Tax=Candidatus Kapaibacterium thiocyanatum TaxID=1895771 RepID=A0A1M3L617_9BACT|nr:MAG: hypothetical protein BGO89_05135 ['Candidatus Kapabacteria' thiocyanatum]
MVNDMDTIMYDHFLQSGLYRREDTGRIVLALPVDKHIGIQNVMTVGHSRLLIDVLDQFAKVVGSDTDSRERIGQTQGFTMICPHHTTDDHSRILVQCQIDRVRLPWNLALGQTRIAGAPST